MNQRQWQEVEAIVRKEQERALQHLNNARYDELRPILDELYKLAHDQPQNTWIPQTKGIHPIIMVSVELYPIQRY